MVLETLAELSNEARAEFLGELSPPEQRLIVSQLFDWESNFARESQRYPDGLWSTWVINAGRGYGKTRTGSENVRRWAEDEPGVRIAMVARTSSDVRDTMVEGESGIMAICPPWNRPHYEPSKRRLTWPNGSMATTYTAVEPDLLRGPQFHKAWADEVASWQFLTETWTNLQLTLRLGNDPRLIVTTTPKPLKWLRDLIDDPTTITTGGSTYENKANLAAAFFDNVTRLYEGTTVGRQELFAEILDEAEGALWMRSDIDASRTSEHPDLDRLVVAIDPAVSANEQSDETGIVAVGRAMVGANGRQPAYHFYVLADVSGRYAPLGWAERAIHAFEDFQGDRIVGEVNNGGDMVETTLRVLSPDVPYKAVHASRGKQARAEPIAALYQQGRVHHVGMFDALEDQQCNWVPNTGARSPDRIDALVWAITELMGDSNAQVFGLGRTTQRDRTSPWRNM